MPDVILIGLSRFARRRVLPALGDITVHVASRSATDHDLAAAARGRTFRDYAEALALPPGLAYISLTNDAHATWAEHALARGHHVIVDKPAFLDLPTAERLVALARARGLVLAEATTWTYHPQLAALLAEFPTGPQLVTAHFTAPMTPGNFRLQRAFGGGARLDLGPYAASIGRALWRTPPTSVTARITADNGEVDTAFSLLAEFGGGRTLVGHFGFTVEYRNWLHAAAEGVAVETHAIFSGGPEVTPELAIRRRDVVSTVAVPPAFAMERFLASVLAAIARGDVTTHSEDLLADARVRAQLA